ncbi:Right handed beta helix region [Arachidicoccus rhizosphaerae]|uniref:Right handed beta helix region n=1 Tax=Arachidicoccus rhizosphaerae TaxID=551991 RepID=A0A1H4CUD8_9BACT|nr:helix-turn-helix domain-containing protein [Arachidicoccus rhizosphaerae]SEA64053.1 Right handed beta helix region [Arachidicoccus rhizosphaerae]
MAHVNLLTSFTAEELRRIVREEIKNALKSQNQQQRNLPKGYLTRKSVAKLFSISLNTVDKYCDLGYLQAYEIGSRILFKESEIEKALIPVKKTRGEIPHASIAISVERDNVAIRGLKFIGNPNPMNEYYYPIERRNEKLKNLEIAQCYFIGNKNAAPIQGALFAQGEGIHISHSIFYNCKNAVLSFLNVRDFALSHCIIYGAYEAALWFGYGKDADLPFRFHNNVIAGCHYAVIGYKGLHHNYNFSNSLFSGNKYYLGVNGDQLQPDTINHPTENNVQKGGKVTLEEITVGSVPRNYLNLSPASAGSNLQAGIFK